MIEHNKNFYSLEELKRTRDNLEGYLDNEEVYYFVGAIRYACDEIERLNKKIEQYENPEDMTLMFMWCDEKAKDEIIRLNNIIKRLEEDLREMYLTFGEFSEEYTENKIKELKGEIK